MLFNSLEFVIFFPIVLIVYYLTNPKYRWIVLLTASYLFYMRWETPYVLLIVTATIVDFKMALLLEKTKKSRKKDLLLLISLFVNLGLLVTFKYYNFFAQSLNSLSDYINISYTLPEHNLLLPVGISFYTFQTLGYTIDVYNKKTKAEKSLGHFALYVSFFPQLVAGPIERAKNLLPQLHKNIAFNTQKVVRGLELILWGLVKKVVIANRLSLYVDEVFNNLNHYSGSHVAIATVFFAFQIFCDFSGYSDIAIGAAKMLGVDLMLNFRRPYFAKSIRDFWKRWHISLSTWFRDFVYFPLGGSRVNVARTSLNLLITFLISGLWHGANWTFVLWGAFHGGLIVSEGLFNRVSKIKIPNFIKIPSTFVLVNIGWILFRANNISDAGTAFKLLFSRWTFSDLSIKLYFGQKEILITILLLIAMEIIHFVQEARKTEELPFFNFVPINVKRFSYLLLASLLLFLGVNGSDFIYFQF